MQLAEISFITDKVAAMTDFYRRLPGVVPVGAQRAWQFSLRTRRRYQTCEQLMQQGLMLEIPPHDFYWGRSAYFRDPDGHQIEIMRMEKSHAG